MFLPHLNLPQKSQHVDYPTLDIGRECANILVKRIAQGKRSSSAKARITYGMNLVLKGSEKLANRKTL